jgi:hypothetical protein
MKSKYISFGSLGLLLTVQQLNQAHASEAKLSQQVTADIESLSSSLSEALAESGSYSEAFSESEI